MKEYCFPLFGNAEDFLECFQGRVKFGLEELVHFSEHVHYTGSFSLDSAAYENASEILGPLKGEIEPLFARAGSSIFLRGKEYYCRGSFALPQEKIELMFRNIRKLNSMLPKLSSLREPNNVDEAALAASVFDHIKHYVMVAFNAVYRKCLNDENEESLSAAFNLCDSFISAYYETILNGKQPMPIIDEELIELIQSEVQTGYIPTEIDFYREMDNPQRILLHAGNIMANTNKRYCIVVNPLSGATEPGFALRAISRACCREVVSGVLPLRYSFYQDVEGRVEDFDSLVDMGISKCFASLIPPDKSSPILILDDNVATGETLANLRVLFQQRYKNVDTSAIEARRKYYEKFDDYDTLTGQTVIDNLAFKPIGETRRNRAIYEFVNQVLVVGGVLS